MRRPRSSKSQSRHRQCPSIAASISAMRKGWPTDLGQRLRVDQKLVAQHGLELAAVHLGHEDMLEALEQDSRDSSASARCGGCGCGLTSEPAAARAAHRLVDRAEGRAPADDRQLAACRRRGRRPGRGSIRRRQRPWRRACRSSPGGPRANSRCCRCPAAFSMPPMRCSRPGRAGLDPRPRELVVAGVGHDRLALGRRLCRRTRPGTARSRAMSGTFHGSAALAM